MGLFMQDIEEDPELRQHIHLFRNDGVIQTLEAQLGKGARQDKKQKNIDLFKATLIQGEDAHEDSDESWESIEEDFPMIGVDELVDVNFEI